ncbi:MAG: Enoyl-CoA hydratase/isomerase [Enterovirga sp.]|nr:Enoyl-CoA hydratase/isomerase [Enterovirga sp.]
MSAHVAVTAEAGNVVLVRLARPDKKNALTGAMYDAVREALAEADRSGAGAVVLTGSDGVFTAGNDLADFLAVSEGGSGGARPAQRFIRQLAGTQTPLVAAVDGLAIGVGTTLTLHCDLVFATARTTFRMPFVDLGLVPEAGSSHLLPRRVGHLKAAELLLLGDPYDGADAVRLGLANALLAPEDLLPRALAEAARLAGKPRDALTATRRLLRGDRAALTAAIDAEFAAFDMALTSPEAKAAIQAFLERGRGSKKGRPPSGEQHHQADGCEGRRDETGETRSEAHRSNS